MKNLNILSEEDVTQCILKFYDEYLILFSDLQSSLLSNLYKRHQSAEKGNIVLFFSRESQKKILRNKDYDLGFDLSFIKFWENHKEINHLKHSISDVSLKICLPKETTRRNILQLINQKVLGKEKGVIGFIPNENYKNNFRKFTEIEIDKILQLIKFVADKLEFSINVDDINKDFRKNFSFYWFHYLGAQIEYLKEWRKNINDLDLLLIYYKCMTLYSEKGNFEKDSDEMNINTELISDSTGIPRATCLRKIEKLLKINSIDQNKISKRYFVSSETFKKSKIADLEKSVRMIRTHCKFYFTCIKALNFKI